MHSQNCAWKCGSFETRQARAPGDSIGRESYEERHCGSNRDGACPSRPTPAEGDIANPLTKSQPRHNR